MPLTVKKVDAAKPRQRKYLLPDGGGLNLQVLPSGTKSFVYRYRRPVSRKENILTYGTYPEISLREARELHQEARKLLSKGVDPGEEKKRAREKADESAGNFEVVAREWLERFSPEWSDKNTRTVKGRLVKNVFPFVGQRKVWELTASDMLAVVRRVEARGALETARRVRGSCSQVFRYAISTGRADRDPAADIKGVLPPVNKTLKHHAALTEPKEVGGLMRAIEEYSGHYIVKCLLKVGAYTFLRSSELRFAVWSEIDLQRAEWRIPAERMKMKTPHIVPLSRQVVEVLRGLHSVSHDAPYVFHGIWKTSKPISENTGNTALRRMGYTKEEQTFHGLRATASTLLYENGWTSEVVERQLAHIERNQVRAAYDHAQYLEKRRVMMQWYADYLDSLREGGKVVPFPVKAS